MSPSRFKRFPSPILDGSPEGIKAAKSAGYLSAVRVYSAIGIKAAREAGADAVIIAPEHADLLDIIE